jgi:hypothetical protein
LPGGAPVDMYVCTTCGGPRRGIYSEMINYLNENHTIDRVPILPFNNGLDGCNHWWVPYSYAEMATCFINREKNITLLTGTRATDVIYEKQGDRTVVVGVRAGSDFGNSCFEIKAKITIDATGTGILADMAKCDVRYGADLRSDFDEHYAPTEKNNIVMPCTLKYITQRLSGTEMPKADLFAKPKIRAGFVEDKLYNWASAVYDDALKNNCGMYLHWGATVSCDDTRDTTALGRTYMEALTLIKHNAKKWYECGYTINIAPKIGVRECRRVIGDYVLTLYDMLDGNFPQDTIAISEYGVDLWGSTVVDEKELNLKFKPYGIPYRALIPKNTDGMLIAGKSISGSRFACSSYRVQPIVAQIGEAAGVAASLCVKESLQTREIKSSKIQSILGI